MVKVIRYQKCEADVICDVYEIFMSCAPGNIYRAHTVELHIYVVLTVQLLYDQQKLFKKSPDAKIPL